MSRKIGNILFFRQLSYLFFKIGQLVFQIGLVIRIFLFCRSGFHCRFGRPRLFVARCPRHSRCARHLEWIEGAHGLLEHVDVLARHFLKFCKGVRVPHDIGQVFAHGFLVFGKRLHGHFQILRHDGLQIITIKTNELAQEVDRQKVLAFALFFENNLRQNGTGNVFAGFGIFDDKLVAFLDHDAKMIKRHIAAGRRVVETAICVFLDQDGLASVRGIVGFFTQWFVHFAALQRLISLYLAIFAAMRKYHVALRNGLNSW